MEVGNKNVQFKSFFWPKCDQMLPVIDCDSVTVNEKSSSIQSKSSFNLHVLDVTKRWPRLNARFGVNQICLATVRVCVFVCVCVWGGGCVGVWVGVTTHRLTIIKGLSSAFRVVPIKAAHCHLCAFKLAIPR